MNKQARESLDAYFAQGDSWAQDRQEALRGSRRIAWIIAGVATLVALFEAVAIIVMMPLKTVEPYTLMVDRQTGFVQALKPLEAQQISGDAALTQSFLVQYVIAREGFDINSLQTDYRKVALWSSGAARSTYLTDMQVSSGASPLALYPRSTVVEVRVKSVTSIGRKVAMIRFDTRRRDAGSNFSAASPWVVVVRYGYSGAPMKVEDRYFNPLGFQVVRYRKSAEALPEPEPIATVAPATATPTTATPAPEVAPGPYGYPRIVRPSSIPPR